MESRLHGSKRVFIRLGGISGNMVFLTWTYVAIDASQEHFAHHHFLLPDTKDMFLDSSKFVLRILVSIYLTT